MTARIGADDVGLFTTPRTRLLREITRLAPEPPAGVHALLAPAGIRSTQRLALADIGGGVVAATWPAELKPQAEYLYQAGRAGRMIKAAQERGWSVSPSPHLAFFNSPSTRRLYMKPDVTAEQYVQRWESADRNMIGQHPLAEAEIVWRWLKRRDYASDSDDDVFKDFLKILGNRPVHLRPGLRLQREWDSDEVTRLGTENELVSAIRNDVNAILRAAGEPTLPVASPQ
jgi:hypothetical protein